MAENPKLDSAATEEIYGLEEKMGTQKISVSDHINGFHYTADKSDSFVIDMESFSHATDKDITPNSRVSRNLSRKWSQRDVEKKINYNAISTDRDVLAGGASSPLGSSTPKSPLAMGTIDHSSNPQVHHQITVTAANIGTTTDGRCVVRRNSFRRSSSWAIDPKRVLFFFATMSSIGTILLIYFTLSIAKYNADESLDWQQ
ncbi:unnamed protein product [Prunus armeniaca]